MTSSALIRSAHWRGTFELLGAVARAEPEPNQVVLARAVDRGVDVETRRADRRPEQAELGVSAQSGTVAEVALHTEAALGPY